MKNWKGWKWCFAFTLLSFLLCLSLIANAHAKGGPNPDRIVIFGFAVMMMSTFYPFFAALIVVLPYALLTKRWYALGGACLGSLLWYPAIPVFGIVGCVLVSRKLLKRIDRSQPTSGGDSSTLADAGLGSPQK